MKNKIEKINKCEKTMSGKHIWPEWYVYWIKCAACGLINDLEQQGGKDETTRTNKG